MHPAVFDDYLEANPDLVRAARIQRRKRAKGAKGRRVYPSAVLRQHMEGNT